jgi:hypothetical protein
MNHRKTARAGARAGAQGSIAQVTYPQGPETSDNQDTRSSTRRCAQVACGDAQLGGVVRSTPPTVAQLVAYFEQDVFDAQQRHPSNFKANR